MKRKKRRDPNSRSLLKEKAWDAFSKYIRARDCVATTGFPDAGNCVTCGRVYPFKELQAGHFIGGRGNAVLFDERQVNAQCYGCNVGKKGNWVPYEAFMIEKYGKAEVEEMKIGSYRNVDIPTPQLIEIREEYTARFNDILKTAGYSQI